MKRSHAPKIGDFNPDCLKGALSSENITPENNSCVQYLGRDVHHDSPLGAYTLLEEPSINVISDLVPAELPPHVDLSRRKRKKKKATIGAAPEPENSCLASSAGFAQHKFRKGQTACRFA
ncbi:uncharacterized protein Pyn_25448 [Prunus yedoensis var. nudiflora]|uniref:Uncharacterized protein n=1 Tax=Prunus yedoensis var. nudiflora TaxID=2094558 RepID=A0A314UIR6_PRUYE|nr:uncharacterized protein Pyn_25448 [Prunus yedoensis var. nudiflora]